MYKIKDSESSFELTIWQKEMGSNSSIEQTYLKPFILDQHYEVALTQINLPHTWINVDNEENEMRLITKGKSVTLSKGYYKTVADVARGVQKALGGEVVYEQVPNEGFGKLVLKKGAQLFVALNIARALGMLSEDGQDIAPLLKLLYGENIQSPTDAKQLGFVMLKSSDKTDYMSFIIPLPPETICAHHFSKKTFQSILVTSDIVRDSFVGSETVPILFKHDVNTKPGFLEVIIPKQPDYKRLREYCFDRLKIELNDSQGRPILFQGGEMSITLHFRKKNYL